jgi:hypothetical protein
MLSLRVIDPKENAQEKGLTEEGRDILREMEGTEVENLR